MKRRRVTVAAGDELEAQEEDVKHFVCAHCPMRVVKKQNKKMKMR